MKLKFFIALIFSLLNCTSGIQAQKKSPTPKKKLDSIEIKLLTDQISEALNKYYVFPEKAELMVKQIQKSYENGKFNNKHNPQEIAYLLKTEIDHVHRDGHLQVFFDPATAQQLEVNISNSNDVAVVRKEPVEEIDFDFFHKLELMPGSMGYIRFDDFPDNIAKFTPTLQRTFQLLKNCRVLFIDLRFNGGGEPEMVSQIESYFFRSKTRLNDIIDRLHNTTTVYYADPKKTNGLFLDMPVYILTSKKTGSAAEDFAYGMQAVKRAVIVGDTTWGGAHPTEDFSIGQGFVASIPYARSYNQITKTDWEGTGVWPDVPVSSELALEEAQQLAFKLLIAKESDTLKRNRLIWQYNYVKSCILSSDAPLDIELTKYAGTYGVYEFFIANNQLLCKNLERGNQIQVPKLIAANFYQLNKYLQIQFEKDVDGKISKIILYEKSGSISKREKSIEKN